MSKATTMRTKTTDSLHLRALRSLDDIQSDVELSEATSETNQPFRNGLIAHCRAHVEETPPSQAVHEEASPPPSPPRLIPKSSVRSRRSSMRMQSMDDNYCDRLRSSSSFGWYDESVAFESMDTPQSTHHEMDAWRDHNGWGGMRTAQQHDDGDQENVQFQMPHSPVTTTRTFQGDSNGRPEAHTIAIGATRVIRESQHTSHAEYQVVMSNNQTYRQWKRFSDFKLLAEYAKISDFRESVMAWRRVQQTQRWFRCLDADYLQTKCMLLERFLAQLLFEVPTPSLLLTFVGALPSDFRR